MDIRKQHVHKMPKNKRVYCTHTTEIHAPAGKVFTLLCPVAEYDWIDGWDCNLVFTESGANEEGCIFTEELMGPVLAGSTASTTWITNRYNEENRHIQFVIFVHDKAVVRYDVTLTDRDKGLTRAEMNFEITAMNDEIGHLSDEDIRARLMVIVEFLAKALKHYCETGEILKAA
jgi:hypothetical protein